MIYKYGKQHTIEQFKNKDVVTLTIPCEDRASTNNLQVSALIIAVFHENQFQLPTEHDILEKHYPT